MDHVPLVATMIGPISQKNNGLTNKIIPYLARHQIECLAINANKHGILRTKSQTKESYNCSMHIRAFRSTYFLFMERTEYIKRHFMGTV